MLIGEVSRRTKFSRDTIRYYEKRKLIVVAPSTSKFNGYKNYDEKVVQRLLLIKRAKGFGFSLNEIAGLLEMIDMNMASCNFFAEKVKEKLSSIDEKIKDLERMKNMILSRVEDANGLCSSLRKRENCALI